MKFQYLSLKKLPNFFKDLAEPPEGLYFKGSLEFINRPNIGVVGAREMQPCSRDWLENELSPFVRDSKRVVVSGGARGVDQQAHSISLRNNQPTIVVLPCGFEVLYPKFLNSWKNNPNILFVSEYPPEQEMRRFHFYKRNRLIAALCDFLLVVEAKDKSGTMITAQFATDQGVDVLVPPGSVVHPNFTGNNQLLFDGAQMVRGYNDLKSLIPVSSQQENTGR